MRFVSTPEVLERFVTIEKEIVQIENSMSTDAEGLLRGFMFVYSPGFCACNCFS